jgi:hypothetical protein
LWAGIQGLRHSALAAVATHQEWIHPAHTQAMQTASAQCMMLLNPWKLSLYQACPLLAHAER